MSLYIFRQFVSTMAEEEGRKFGWWWSPFRGAQVFEVGVDDDGVKQLAIPEIAPV